VHGPEILARTLTPIREFGKKGYRGQYHQQSDHHSKVVSWAILFDLLIESQLFRDHVAAGKVIAGVNHEMSDFEHGRKKNLDLVIARPREDGGPLLRTFAEIADHYDIRLTAEEFNVLEGLPQLREGPVGSVLVAVEAKATMTAHQKARPRLYDELNSSHATVHGAADQAVAAAAVMVNHADVFLTYDLNRLGVDSTPPLVFTRHSQPHDTQVVLDKLQQLPRRAGTGTFGFDAVGVIVVDCRNDGSPVSIVSANPAPSAASDYHYDQMVRRVASHYAFRFSRT
jgi:hypothetical protein